MDAGARPVSDPDCCCEGVLQDFDLVAGSAGGVPVSFTGICREVAMDIVHPRVAGIDVHKKVIWVAVRLPCEAPGERKVNVRSFKTFWRSLQKMAAWLAELGVTDAAMESTPVIRGANTKKLDTAQVVLSRARPRRQGQKRQRREVAARCALRSAVCVAEGPADNASAAEGGTGKPGCHPLSQTPTGDPGLPATTGGAGTTCCRRRVSSAGW